MISICIPCYNSGHYIDDSLRSACASDPDLVSDILVCDNASTDDTVERATAWSSRDRRVRLHRNQNNLGSRGNLQLVTYLARNDVIKYLCADDVLLPSCLENQYDALSKGRGDLITCNMLVVDRALQKPQLHEFFPGRNRGRDIVGTSLTLRENLIGGPTNFLFDRRKASNAVLWDSAYRLISDVIFADRLLGASGFVFNSGAVGYLYRRHENSDTALQCSVREVNDQEWVNAKAEVFAPGNLPIMVLPKHRLIVFKLRRRLKIGLAHLRVSKQKHQ